MNISVILDWLTAMLVLIGIFLLAYSAIRHQGIKETLMEIRDIMKDKAEEIGGKTPYA